MLEPLPRAVADLKRDDTVADLRADPVRHAADLFGEARDDVSAPR